MCSASTGRLIFRADGNATIGLGHLMRLLALADMLRGLAAGIFMVREPTPNVERLITTAGWGIHQLPTEQTLDEEARFLAHQFLQPSDVLILDGYNFILTYQQRLRQSGCYLVYVDDLREWPVVADVLINHSPGIMPTDYDAPATAQLLLGPAFSLLRRPFIAAAALPKSDTIFTSALICFGGADPLYLTERTLMALLMQPQIKHIDIVVGAAFAGVAKLRYLATQHPTHPINLHVNVNAEALVKLMQMNSIIVVPASTILIEALVLGRPVITGFYASNQQDLANYVHVHQQAFSVGNLTDLGHQSLVESLRQGISFLAKTSLQPYTNKLRPDLLRASIAALLPA